MTLGLPIILCCCDESPPPPPGNCWVRVIECPEIGDCPGGAREAFIPCDFFVQDDEPGFGIDPPDPGPIVPPGVEPDPPDPGVPGFGQTEPVPMPDPGDVFRIGATCWVVHDTVDELPPEALVFNHVGAQYETCEECCGFEVPGCAFYEMLISDNPDWQEGLFINVAGGQLNFEVCCPPEIGPPCDDEEYLACSVPFTKSGVFFRYEGSPGWICNYDGAPCTPPGAPCTWDLVTCQCAATQRWSDSCNEYIGFFPFVVPVGEGPYELTCEQPMDGPPVWRIYVTMAVAHQYPIEFFQNVAVRVRYESEILTPERFLPWEVEFAPVSVDVTPGGLYFRNITYTIPELTVESI